MYVYLRFTGFQHLKLVYILLQAVIVLMENSHFYEIYSVHLMLVLCVQNLITQVGALEHGYDRCFIGCKRILDI